MDTRPQRLDVSQDLEIIRTRMPETYASIKGKAQEVGNQVYEWVRRGLRGEPNCFYAMEAGFVMGTPFAHSAVTDAVARNMVAFGVKCLCIFPEVKGAAHGAD